MPVRIILLLGAIALCGGGAQAATLYDELGGQAGLTAIVGSLLDTAASDPRLSDKFDDINLTRLKGRLYQQLCDLSGGPCHYTGISMKGAHTYLHLHDRHFNAMVEDLQGVMDRAGIPFRIQNRLLAVLAPLHRDIVNP